MKNVIVEKLQDALIPIANKFGNQRHVKAISSGLMYVIPLSLLAAIFNIIANPPITQTIIQNGGWYANLFSGWFNFAQKYASIITIPSNMTMGMIAVIAVLGISYNLANSYSLKAFSTALLSLIMFLIVAAPAIPAYLASAMTEGVDMATLRPVNVLDTTFLGAAGLFVAIIVALLSTEITRFCQVKNLTIKMPDTVPPMVAESFSSVIPAIINCVIFFGSNLLLQNVFGMNLPGVINTVLTPAIENVNNPIMIMAIITLGNLLWLVGIHGAAITSMLYIPIMMQMTAANGELVAGGQQAIYHPVFIAEFANTYFGLALLLLFAKSSQLKAVGKVGIIPSIFVISEPIIFGVPIMFNPILAIPHLLTPIITMTLAWFAGSVGLIKGSFSLIFAQLPLGLNAFFSSMSLNNFIFYFVMILVQIVCWYPFFKIYDRQLVKQEQAEETVVNTEETFQLER